MRRYSKCAFRFGVLCPTLADLASLPKGTMYDGYGHGQTSSWLIMVSYIEENHTFKLDQWQSQRSRPARPGAPSQDLMSFWGTFSSHKCDLPIRLTLLVKDISSKPYP